MKRFFAIFLLIGWTTALAQPMTELEATPSVLSEPDAILLITEVSFKNTQADWVKMHYHSPAGKPANLKGIGFGDDKIFKTIQEDFIIASGQDLLLTFKSEETNAMPYLYSSRGGLTGTTEQFIIYDQDNSVLDAVCWTSATPTDSEIQEQAELYELEGWNSPDINSCIFSDTLKKEESIIRNGLTDTNTSNDWIIPQEEITTEILETPDVQDVVTPASTTTSQEEVPTPQATTEQVNLTPPTVQEPLQSPDLVNVTTPAVPEKDQKSSSSSSKKKSSTPAYTNGDRSTNITISEILPNPDGTDAKNEWVEITNPGTEAINLGNWQLDDGEDGSKPYAIPDSIILEPGQALAISTKDSGLSLGNKEDMVRLFNFEGELVHEIDYEEAPSGQSYSLILIQKEDGDVQEEWLWTEEMTPNEPNPEYMQFRAEVVTEPSFQEQYSFEVQDKTGQKQTIIFDEGRIAGPLAKATFTPGTSLLLTIEPDQQKLIQFEVLAKAMEQNPFPPLLIPSVIGTIIILAAGTFYLVHKKIPWREATETV